MHTDPISDLLTRIRNALKAHHMKVTVPYSSIKENMLKVMKEKEFISNYKTGKEGNFQVLEVELKEDNPYLTLKRVSKPGQRIYTKYNQLKTIKSGLGIQIISTPKGVMSNIEAKKENLGGEILCEIY